MNECWKALDPIFQHALRKYVIEGDVNMFELYGKALGFTAEQIYLLYLALSLNQQQQQTEAHDNPNHNQDSLQNDMHCHASIHNLMITSLSENTDTDSQRCSGHKRKQASSENQCDGFTEKRRKIITASTQQNCDEKMSLPSLQSPPPDLETDTSSSASTSTSTSSSTSKQQASTSTSTQSNAAQKQRLQCLVAHKSANSAMDTSIKQHNGGTSKELYERLKHSSAQKFKQQNVSTAIAIAPRTSASSELYERLKHSSAQQFKQQTEPNVSSIARNNQKKINRMLADCKAYKSAITKANLHRPNHPVRIHPMNPP
mmetsp:Transcript_30249/g.49269  ORF Transcript_30249/g.49269 Transcript_30249/m.49269 type:complete len:315 (+) Transcript_30249:110-1054(+)|eukprot:CAMPEP_0202690944 /NCGR_PEP_ID=MMETSP1385-20130828/5807_1 /ASSEMBLY_ACC=CAM_ASM_000861 /TAXON_ID=933848 /ORGANISM="Elphidium margaritaceum" /LENGTH=314 /DNA_ID=CAMNT_0049346283 /DNA_START=90 /DNA_END=1037 /DNA_ORIENTATION=-